MCIIKLEGPLVNAISKKLEILLVVSFIARAHELDHLLQVRKHLFLSLANPFLTLLFSHGFAISLPRGLLRTSLDTSFDSRPLLGKDRLILFDSIQTKFDLSISFGFFLLVDGLINVRIGNYCWLAQ